MQSKWINEQFVSDSLLLLYAGLLWARGGMGSSWWDVRDGMGRCCNM